MSGILRRIDSALVEKDGEDASYIYTLIHTYTHIHTCPYMYKNIHTYSALPVPYQDWFPPGRSCTSGRRRILAGTRLTIRGFDSRERLAKGSGLVGNYRRAEVALPGGGGLEIRGSSEENPRKKNPFLCFWRFGLPQTDQKSSYLLGFRSWNALKTEIVYGRTSKRRPNPSRFVLALYHIQFSNCIW